MNLDILGKSLILLFILMIFILIEIHIKALVFQINSIQVSFLENPINQNQIFFIKYLNLMEIKLLRIYIAQWLIFVIVILDFFINLVI